MKRLKLAAPMLLMVMVSLPLSLSAQQQEGGLSTRNIRARKLAQNWRGETVQLTLADGRRVVGKFVGADFYSFTLETKDEQFTFSIDEVKAVTLKPGFMEAGLAVAGGILGGGLGAGIVTLTAPGSSVGVVATAAVLGAGAGFWWGYKTFYQEVVIELIE